MCQGGDFERGDGEQQAGGREGARVFHRRFTLAGGVTFLRMDPKRVHGDVQGGKQGAFAAVYALVRRIPKRRVMTYGQIATLIENRLSPRAVGWAMAGCPEDVPWQRVVNARGRSSLPGEAASRQQHLLEREGVVFEGGRIDLARYRWRP